MSALLIVATSPDANETDVVLGRPVDILFDQPIDPATVTSAVFSLMGPGQTSVINAAQMTIKDVQQVGRETIPGTFSFPDPATLRFTPSSPLRPDVIYTVLLVGRSSLLAKSYVANLAGEPLEQSLQFTFRTGELQLNATPPASPLTPSLSWERPKFAPTEILVRPRKVVGVDLTQQIELIFPAEIDPASFNMQDLIIAGEPLLGDPETPVPESSATVTISGNRLLITVLWGQMPQNPPEMLLAERDTTGTGPVPVEQDMTWIDPNGNEPLIRVS